ncbi:MAG: hypothetical protein OXH90_03740 [Paracoccaceae bacterium]|nr:hypothetical protein [Paracoccaceae bacterium]MDE2916943.1 hypothetical protein [Paracoccaceae bacterium]
MNKRISSNVGRALFMRKLKTSRSGPDANHEFLPLGKEERIHIVLDVQQAIGMTEFGGLD